MKSVRYEGSCFIYGWSHVTTNCEIRSVILLQTIGVMPICFFMYFL